MRVRSWIIAPAAALALSAASARAAFTITNGNATFNMTAVSNIFPTSSLSTADFRPEGGTTTDHVFYYNWGYRVPLGSNTGMSQLVTPTVVVAGDTATITSLDNGPGPTGQNRFDSVNTIRIEDGANPGEAALFSSQAVTARPQNSGPVTFQFIHVVDVDFNGTTGSDTFTMDNLGLVSGNVVDSANPSLLGLYDGIGATRYEVAASATVRGRLNGGNANLGNTASFAGDGGYAFQWEVTLAPGESRTFQSSFRTVVPEPASMGLLALSAPALLRRRRA